MTIYRLAKSQSDYNKCRDKHGSSQNFNYPTVMAERDGLLVGYLSSYDFKPDRETQHSSVNRIDYAPSAVQADSIHILMKMFNMYDETLALHSQFYYVIHISRENKPIIRVLNNHKNVVLSGGNEKFLYYTRGIAHE